MTKFWLNGREAMQPGAGNLITDVAGLVPTLGIRVLVPDVGLAAALLWVAVATLTFISMVRREIDWRVYHSPHSREPHRGSTPPEPASSFVTGFCTIALAAAWGWFLMELISG